MDPKVDELIMAAFLVAQHADRRVAPFVSPYFRVNTDYMARLDDALMAMGHAEIAALRKRTQ